VVFLLFLFLCLFLGPLAADNIITPYVYTWNGISYENVKSLGSFQPGKGYWFKAKVNCELVFHRL